MRPGDDRGLSQRPGTGILTGSAQSPSENCVDSSGEEFWRWPKAGNPRAQAARPGERSLADAGRWAQPPTSLRASSANAVLRYRSPVEQAIVTMVLPLFSGRCAT